MKQRVLLKGADALDLIHRISTVDIKRLNLNEKKSALFLNPQGKILCYFEVILISKDSVQIDFDERFLEIFDQYTFSEQYQIEPLPAAIETPTSEKERILNLIPKVGFEFDFDGTSNPLEVNLRNAISDQKGCYPGQEIIEKIIAIGSPAKKLCLVESKTHDSLILPLQLLGDQNEEAGVLTSFVDGVGLAIIKRTHLKEGIFLKNQNLQFLLKKVSS